MRQGLQMRHGRLLRGQSERARASSIRFAAAGEKRLRLDDRWLRALEPKGTVELLSVALAREKLDDAEQHLKMKRDALRRLDIVRGNRLCGSAVGGILARPDARHIGLAGGLVVAFFVRPIVVVDSQATSLFHRRR